MFTKFPRLRKLHECLSTQIKAVRFIVLLIFLGNFRNFSGLQIPLKKILRWEDKACKTRSKACEVRR